MTVEQEIRRILFDMRQAAISACNPEQERMTTEIATRAMQEALPTFDMPDSLISAYAQTAVVKAWRAFATQAVSEST